MAMCVAMPMTPMTSVVSIVLRMMSMSESLYYSIETTVWSSFIFDYSNCAISLLEGIRSLNVVAVSVFMLFFNVACVGIMYLIFEIVLCWPLENYST